MGHALEEVGCIWLGLDPDRVEAEAPVAISRFLGWLRLHGEPGFDAAASEGEVYAQVAQVQEIDGFGHAGAAVGFFKPDLELVHDGDIATTVRRLGYAKRELLEEAAAGRPRLGAGGGEVDHPAESGSPEQGPPLLPVARAGRRGGAGRPSRALAGRCVRGAPVGLAKSGVGPGQLQ